MPKPFLPTLSGLALGLSLAALPAAAQPDLRVGKVEYVGGAKEGGCNVARVTIANDGTTPVSGDIPVAHQVNFIEGIQQRTAVMGGGIGGRTSKTMQIDQVSLWSWGTNFTSVEVDWNQTIAETDESNNRLMVQPALVGYCAKLSVADASAAEGSPMAFAVTLSETWDKAVSVDYAVEAIPGLMNAATPGSKCGRGIDVVAASGTLQFAKGEKSKRIVVQTCSDDKREGEEVFALRLSNPVHAELGRATAAGKISD